MNVLWRRARALTKIFVTFSFSLMCHFSLLRYSVRLLVLCRLAEPRKHEFLTYSLRVWQQHSLKLMSMIIAYDDDDGDEFRALPRISK